MPGLRLWIKDAGPNRAIGGAGTADRPHRRVATTTLGTEIVMLLVMLIIVATVAARRRWNEIILF